MTENNPTGREKGRVEKRREGGEENKDKNEKEENKIWGEEATRGAEGEKMWRRCVINVWLKGVTLTATSSHAFHVHTVVANKKVFQAS